MKSIKKYLKEYSTEIIMGACIAFILIVSSFVFLDKSLRLDEAQSISQTTHSLIGTLETIAKDVHVPLYFVVLRGWEMLFGTSVETIRYLSLIFFIFSIPAFYLLGKTTYGKKSGLCIMVIASVSPFLFWYGSEARMYSFLLLLTILNQYFFMLVWKKNRGLEQNENIKEYAWVAYGVTALFGALTHYFFSFILLVQAIYFLLNRKQFEKGSFFKFFTVAALVAAELGAWFAFRVIIGTSDTSPLLKAPSSIDFFNIFSNFFIGLQSNSINSFFLSLWPLVVFAVFLSLEKKLKIKPETVYLIMSAAMPIALVLIISTFLRPLFLSRYLIIVVPSLYLLTVNYLHRFKRPGVVTIIIAIIMGSMLFVQGFSAEVPANEDFRAISEYVTKTGGVDDIYIVTAPFLIYPAEYYYRGDSKISTFPVWERYKNVSSIPEYSEESLRLQMEEWSKSYTTAYVLLGYDQGYQENMRLFLDQNYERIDVVTFSPGLTMYVYKLKYLPS